MFAQWRWKQNLNEAGMREEASGDTCSQGPPQTSDPGSS